MISVRRVARASLSLPDQCSKRPFTTAFEIERHLARLEFPGDRLACGARDEAQLHVAALPVAHDQGQALLGRPRASRAACRRAVR